jgi:hypothetical protein
MATKTMEARAVISAKDNTGGVFDKIGSKLDRLASKGKSIDGLGRSMNNIGNLNVKEFEMQAKRLDGVLRKMDNHARQARRLEDAGTRVQKVWDGAGSAMAAFAAASTSRRLAVRAIKQGADLQAEGQHLRNVGRTPKDMEEIEAKASEVARTVPTSTKAENLKAINETIGAFGSVHHAVENLEQFQKIASVVKSIAGDKIGIDAGQMAYYMARFGEMRGTVQDPKRFRSETDQLAQAMYFTRGNFNPTELFHFGRRAGTATLRNYSQDYTTRVLPSIITEMTGDTAGVQARAFKDLIQGRIRDRVQVKAWQDLGLIDPKKVRQGKGGEPMSWQADAMKNWKLAFTDPDKWMDTTVIPAMRAKGFDPSDPFVLTKFFGEMARNSSSNNMMTLLGDPQQRARIQKDRTLMNEVKPINEIYSENLTKNPHVALEAFTAQFNNLLAVAAGPSMQKAGEGLATLSAALSNLSGMAEKHPQWATAGLLAAVGGAGLGTFAATRGVLSMLGIGGVGGVGGSLPMMARAAMGGPLGLTLGGIGAAGIYAGETYGYGKARGIGSTGYAKQLRASLDDDEALRQRQAAEARAAAQAKAMTQDWSLGSTGKFQQAPRTETPTGSFGQMSGAALRDALSGIKLDATVKPDQITAPLTGSAEVKGQAQVNVTVTASSALLEIVEKAKSTTMALAGQLRANGPGSTGRSSPDAAAPSTGSGAP